MKYATATGFRTALDERLLAASRRSGRPIILLRKLAAFDRLLARLLRAVVIVSSDELNASKITTVLAISVTIHLR